MVYLCYMFIVVNLICEHNEWSGNTTILSKDGKSVEVVSYVMVE